MRAFHADGLHPGDGATLRDAAVVVDDGGAIVDVGRAEDILPRHAGVSIERVRGVVMPGLVNAHTHLELSALRGRVPGGAGFLPWVERLIGARSEVSAEEEAEAISAGLAELEASGTVGVGDVTNGLGAVRGLAERGFAGVVFHEVFGVDAYALDRRIDALPSVAESTVGAWPSRDLAYAPSPHTLYTTHAHGVRRLAREARAAGRRLTLHLAEHAAERRFLERGDGPVADWAVSRMKVTLGSLPFPGQPPIDFADALGCLHPDAVVVHLTDATPPELSRVAERGAHVVLCPRSNLHIESRCPPLLSMLAAGLSLSLGTDSLASCASLDVLREARALADRFPGVSPAALITMATWGGARALGRTDLGRLTRGSRPGLVAVEGPLDDQDPSSFLLRRVAEPRRRLVERSSS